MIVATDVHYRDDGAKAVAVVFDAWGSADPAAVHDTFVHDVEPYESGSFYKRELPCISAVLKLVDLTDVEAIVVDGYVYLDDHERPGLGAHLYAELEGMHPVIGVAKTSFRGVTEAAIPVKRGASEVPVFVSAIGMSLGDAARNIESMHGKFRIPTLLTLLDRATKTGVGS
jgi:deoxyribonuclease V